MGGGFGHVRFNAGDPTLLLKLADLTYLRALQEVFMVNADYGLNRHLYAVMDREARTKRDGIRI